MSLLPCSPVYNPKIDQINNQQPNKIMYQIFGKMETWKHETWKLATVGFTLLQLFLKHGHPWNWLIVVWSRNCSCFCSCKLVDRRLFIRIILGNGKWRSFFYCKFYFNDLAYTDRLDCDIGLRGWEHGHSWILNFDCCLILHLFLFLFL